MPGPLPTDRAHRAVRVGAGIAGGGFGAALALSERADPIAAVLVAVAFAVLGVASAALIRSDLRHRRLPNRVLGPTAALVTCSLGCASLLDDRPERLFTGLGAAAVGGAVALLAWRIGAGIGGGDVKLIPILLFTLGWAAGPARLIDGLLASACALALGTVILLLAVGRRDAGLPFGPALLGAAWCGLGWACWVGAAAADVGPASTAVA